jgi:hypothetical protein
MGFEVNAVRRYRSTGDVHIACHISPSAPTDCHAALSSDRAPTQSRSVCGCISLSQVITTDLHITANEQIPSNPNRTIIRQLPNCPRRVCCCNLAVVRQFDTGPALVDKPKLTRRARKGSILVTKEPQTSHSRGDDPILKQDSDLVTD